MPDQETTNLELDRSQPRTLGDWVKFQELAGVDTWDEIIAVLNDGPNSPKQTLAVFWLAGTQSDPLFDISEAENALIDADALDKFVEETFGG